MAATTTTDRRLDIGLEQLGVRVAELDEIAAEWPTLAEGERTALSLEWDGLLGYLTLLQQAGCAGRLTAAQSARYRTLRAALRAAAPTIDQLRFTPPPPELLAD